ncbi:glycosyltransferase family 4 protein [Idiomarina seosinensis]|uniref:glycosyltransferase family 4 protein n=1 Tax=Idiomarina seosinensis TaxID=281739 RepID=UPI00384B4212
MSQPINVLVISLYLSPSVGGAETYITEVSSTLRSKGFNLSFLSSDKPESDISPGYRLASARFSPRWHKELTNYIVNSNVDVIYVHATVPAMAEVAVYAAAKHNIPVLLMYHSDVSGNPLYKKVFGRLYNVLIGRRVMRLADHVMTTNKSFYQRSLLLSSLPNLSNKVSFAPPGVSAEFVKFTERKEVKTQPYLIFVGKPDDPNKGFDYLKRAFKSLNLDDNLELYVVGPTTRCNETGIRYLGAVTSRQKLGQLYSQAVATILPSTTSESFGMVLAESLVCGTPVIGTDVGGIPEVIEDEKNGFVVKPKSAEALASAFEKVIQNNSDLRSYISAQNYAEKFSWDKTADHVANVLLKLAQSRP